MIDRNRGDAFVGVGLPWTRFARNLVLLNTLGISVAVAAPLPLATTLGDICPGTPDPCVVTGKFEVAAGTVFDLEGRAFRMAAGSSLIGKWEIVRFFVNHFAKFSIINAASIEIDQKALLSSPAMTASIPCTVEGNQGAHRRLRGPWSHPVEDEVLRLRVFARNNELPLFVGGEIAEWGVRVCDLDGCTEHAATDTPLPLDWHLFPAVDPPYTEGTIQVPTPASFVTSMSIYFEGSSPGPLESNFPDPGGASLALTSPDLGLPGSSIDALPKWGAGVRCGELSFAYQRDELLDLIELHSTGSCVLNGKVLSNAPFDTAGGIRVECDGPITLGPKALVQARGKEYGGTIALHGAGVQIDGGAKLIAPGKTRGGYLELDGGVGDINIGPRAKLDVNGGGAINLRTGGDCTVAGQLGAGKAASGLIRVRCNEIDLASSAKLIASSKPEADVAVWGTPYSSVVGLQATGGGLRMAKGALVRADGWMVSSVEKQASFFRIEALGACEIDGKILARFSGQDGHPKVVTLACSGFQLGSSGLIDASAKGEVAERVSIDTTGVANSGVPGPCVVDGKIRLRGSGPFSGGGDIVATCGTSFELGPKGLLEVSAPSSQLAVGAGTVNIHANGDATIRGVINADSKFGPGEVAVEACDLTIAKGKIRDKGFVDVGGKNTLIAHGTLSMIDAASVDAGPAGENILRYRDGVSIHSSSKVIPATVPQFEPSLSPCP